MLNLSHPKRPEVIKRFLLQGEWKNQDELDKIATEWTVGQTATDAMIKLQKLNIAAAPICYSGT